MQRPTNVWKLRSKCRERCCKRNWDRTIWTTDKYHRSVFALSYDVCRRINKKNVGKEFFYDTHHSTRHSLPSELRHYQARRWSKRRTVGSTHQSQGRLSYYNHGVTSVDNIHAQRSLWREKIWANNWLLRVTTCRWARNELIGIINNVLCYRISQEPRKFVIDSNVTRNRSNRNVCAIAWTGLSVSCGHFLGPLTEDKIASMLSLSSPESP